MENEPRLAESEEKNNAAEVADPYMQISREADILMRDVNDDPFDEKKEADKASCPTGGCSNDKKTYKDIYNDRFESEVKKAKAENSNFNIKDPLQWRGIHMRVAKTMRPEVRQNREYLKPDKEGPAFAKGPEFFINPNGQIYYEFKDEKGNFSHIRTLQEMYADQKRLRPHEYNAKEHATISMMEEAFREGAKQVSHVSHNKDAQGREAIRDQITMVWDADAKKGHMEIRNIALDGNFHSVEKAMEIIGERSGMIAIHPVEGVGIFVDKPIVQSRVASIVKTYGIENRPQDHIKELAHEDVKRTEISEAVIDGVVDTAEHAGKRVQEEMTVVGKNIQRIIAEEVESKRLYMPPFLQRLLGLPNQSIDMQLRAEDILVNGLDIPEVTILTEEKIEAFESSQKGIEITVETGIAIGGALLLLDQIAAFGSQEDARESDGNDLREMQTGVESKALSETLSEAVVDFFESSDIFKSVHPDKIGVQVSDESGEFVEERLRAASVLEKERVDVEALGKIRDIITIINEAPVEQAIAAIDHETEVVIIEMAEVWEVFEEVLQKHESGEGGEAKQEVETHVEQFSALVIFWLLFKLDSYRQSLAALKDVVLGKKDSEKVLEALKGEIPTKLIPKEPTAWILLGIMWHMAQIREQGFATNFQYTSPVVVKKKKSIQTHFLPAQGIIFAVAS